LARASIAITEIAVVTILSQNDAVAASRSTRLAGSTAGLCLATVGTAVEGNVVPVVTTLGALGDTVATRRFSADAGGALALEANFHAALLIAAVFRLDPTVVAPLIGIYLSVPAQVNAVAGLSRSAASIADFDRLAVFGAAVPALDVPVVTGLARSGFSVAADNRTLAGLAGVGTHVEGLHDAGTRAPIPRKRVPIVTGFGGIEIDLTVPASWGRPQDALGGSVFLFAGIFDGGWFLRHHQVRLATNSSATAVDGGAGAIDPSTSPISQWFWCTGYAHEQAKKGREREKGRGELAHGGS
jgi:hypothetical protein